MPKLTKNASSSSLSRSKSSTSLKKISSFKSDSKLSQASLSSFFAKTRPQDAASTSAGPSQTPSSKAAAPNTSKPTVPQVTLPPTTTAPGGINKGKAPRRIIIDDDEEEKTPVRPKPTIAARPVRRPKVENPFITSTTTVDTRTRKTSDLSKLALPFEERMPVSPPDSPAPAPALPLPQETTSTASVSGQIEKPNEVPQENLQLPPKESVGESSRQPKEEQEVRTSSSTSSSSDITKTTPSKRPQSPMKTTPQRKSRAPSPFRTPTEKTKRALLPMESLGLSPEDSVFWAKTPPSEAWKKLKNMDTGRSHEEEAASIIGRLYETSSAGTALQTMDRRPKDRIREMLNTMRGSSEGLDQGLDDEDDDLETVDQPSPTKELVDRLRSNSGRQHGLARYHSAQDLGATIRKRGRRVAPALTKPAPMSFLSPNKRRDDVLKMIEQIQENMSGGSSSDTPCLSAEDLPPRKRVHLDKADAGSRKAASGSNTPTRTPTRNRSLNLHSSPGDFDDMFTDLDMDDNAFEELTQHERSSTWMSSASASSANISSPFSSVTSSSDKGMSNVRRELADLGVDAPSYSQPTTSSLANQNTPAFDKPAASIETTADLAVDDFGDLDDLGDDFDLYDLDDAKPASQAVRIEGAKYKRYKVNDVKDGIVDPRWHGQSKVLMLQEVRSESVVRIFLRESWVTSKVSVGDIVHVISPYLYTTDVGAKDLMLEDAQGFLVFKPDYLVPTSALAESFSCVRKPIIDIRAKKTDESNIPMIHGTMLHELFQQSLLANDFTTASMEAKIDAMIKDHINDLCLVNESIETAKESFMQQIGSCQDFARRYLQATPRPDGTIDESMGFAASGNTSTLCINKILDIEENIWSPMFGLKGKIDASVQVIVKTSKKNEGAEGVETRILTVPFELKTGKKSNVVSHRAQTMLYTLLMTDRYDVDVQWGLLFYLKTGEFIRVPAPHDEIRTILMQRNEIAFYEEQKLALPPMAKSTSTCRRCFSFSSCTVLHKLLEDGTGETSGIGTMFDEATDHLNETHAEFMRKWNRLLALEQGDVAKFQSQIWTMLSAERLAAGNCFSNLQLIEELDDNGRDIHDRRGSELASVAAFTGHRYRFKLSTPMASPSQQTLSQTLRGGNTLLSSNISVGDPIVVSSENQHYALAIGQVLDLSLSEITVGLDRALLGPPMKLAGYDRDRNQAYRGLMDIAAKPLPVTQRGLEDYHTHLSRNRITFRIDKDEMMAGLARTRNNLVQLFRSDVHGGDAKRRQLVVDLEPPAFDPVEEARHDNADLNDDQRRAIDAVLSARDYALILGMPGTGKTTTIGHIIHTLVARGKSVLLTSYTHSAVDNVLLKLNEDINIVRLGNKEKVHRDIRRRIPDFTEPPLNNVEAIQNFYGRCQVVGTTCLGIGDPIFMTKRFDYCIVDEASQITLPACLGPIRFADVFVLVGDHNQLPPLVKNPEAKKDGFDLSLFRMLSDRYPQSVTSLTQQYRMNQDVMLLSNTLVYKNQLRCANDEVANKVLEIPAMSRFRRHCHPPMTADVFSDNHDDTVAANGCRGHSSSKPCWLEQCLDPQRSVVFIDTDDVPAHEVQVGSSTQNPTEALLVRQLTEALISGGVAEDDIGIISVLRAQLKVLGRLLRSRPLLDIHTVDRYQGKDKECVIVSLVRSNAEQHVGELLKDWRRINVAFTRAKRKLVIFGSRQTLQGSPVFEQFLRLMEQQDWILRIAAQAQHQHPSLSGAWPSLSKKPVSSTSSLSHVQPTMVRARKCPGGRPTLLERLIDEKDEDEDEEEEDKENMERATLALKEVKDARAQENKGARVIRAKPEAVLRAMPICKNILDSL
ncbi:Tripartite DNA replication factor [Mortierella alpina]|nr:Tripartite DNA replication factor [Mortierella alpina]